MEVERDEDDKGSDDQRNNEEISDNDLEEDEEDFLEDFYDERVKDVIMRQLTDAQRERFEQFRTATIDQSKGHNKIKEFVASVLPGISAGHSCKLILSTATKIYAGELIEEARRIMTEKGDKGAVEPHHLREAYRRINNRRSDDKFAENEMLYF